MSPLWRDWFAAGVTRFGLSPEGFWALTLAEWRALTAARGGPAPMGRTDLDTLISRYTEAEDDRG